MTGLRLLDTKPQCCYQSDWRRDETRCPKTTAEDPLLWFRPEHLGRYCEEHGPFVKGRRLTP